jgi:hypothetical protein
MPASTAATRLIFSQFNLFAGPTALSGQTATGAMYALGNSGNNLISQLANVTNCQVTVDIPRQDLNVFGVLERVGQIVVTPPSIQLNANWNVTDGYNEAVCGLNIKGAAFLSGVLTKVSDSKNYFVAYSPQGVDDNYNPDTTTRDTLAIGNGFLSNYTINAAVGQVCTAAISIDALNIAAQYGTSGNVTPAVNPATSAPITTWTYALPVGRTITGAGDIFALRHGDITVEFPPNAGFLVPLTGNGQVNLQSFDLSMPISRQVINRLGSQLGFSREIQFPLNCQLSLRALQTELATGSLSNLLCNDTAYDGKIRLKKPGCAGTATADAIILQINQFRVSNIYFGMTVGGDATVDLQATAQLGGALSRAGVTMSGYYAGL